MPGKRPFPFYDDRPVAISRAGWLLVLAAVAVAFLVLSFLDLNVFPLNYVPALLFAGLPLGALAYVSKGNLGGLFGRYGFKEFGLSLAFAVLTIVVSFTVALVLSSVFSFNANPSGGKIAAMDIVGLLVFLSQTFIQLIGEEAVTILPLLAVLWFSVQKLRGPLTVALIAGVVISTAWFAAMHLPTYQWNFVQCFAIIGTARLVLTAAYLLTRNLWVSAGAHIINDWTIFLFGFAGHQPIES